MYNKRIFDITEKTSSTWNHFNEPENGKVKCRKCGTEMSSKYLQNLAKHLNRCKKVMRRDYIRMYMWVIISAGEASNVEGGDNEDIGSEATDSDRD
uniref:BED-type domain-containing protein n=1 Tax=Meloidogyne javanica TaxID=6303 RepID=A0A915NB69_MELJA